MPKCPLLYLLYSEEYNRRRGVVVILPEVVNSIPTCSNEKQVRLSVQSA